MPYASVMASVRVRCVRCVAVVVWSVLVARRPSIGIARRPSIATPTRHAMINKALQYVCIKTDLVTTSVTNMLDDTVDTGRHLSTDGTDETPQRASL